MIHKSREDQIADNYFRHLNGTLAFIMLGIYFSIIELDYFKNYAIFSSIFILLYLIFWFKEYGSIAKTYTERYRGFKFIIPFLKNFIFMISYGLLISAALGYKIFSN